MGYDFIGQLSDAKMLFLLLASALVSPQTATGEALFYRQWQLPIAGQVKLGPLYNAGSCAACHINNGRGQPPIDGQSDPSFVLRFSIAPQNEAQRMGLALEEYASVADPRYGRQLQDKAIDGVGEGRLLVEYRDKPYKLDDGEVVILHRPVYSLDNLKKGPLHNNVQISARIAQPLHGIGLLAAIRDEDILSAEDPRDKNKDGVSGRANLVRDVVSGKTVLGRFGWKATQPNLRQQVAAAFAQDIGISSSLLPQTGQGCNDDSADCLATNSKPANAEKIEISDDELRLTTQFVSRFRAYQSGAGMKFGTERIGEKLFSETGCISCHRESYKITIKDADGKAKAGTIYPYSDFLLHDMGAGLADHRPVAQASGWEWRTQPLWGIGNAEEINGNKFFLHDGRARTITEAILWHGGEARRARAKFSALSKMQRLALVEFVRGL